MYESKPWLRFFGPVPSKLSYPDATMYGVVHERAGAQPDAAALVFLGKRMTFAELDERIIRISRGLAAEGLKPGDRVLVCLPNVPQAVIVFYALNRLGAVPAMIHPLSAPAEILTFTRQAACTWAVTLDAFYPRFAEMEGEGLFRRTLVCSIPDHAGALVSVAFGLTQGRKIPPVPDRPDIIKWKDLDQKAQSAPELTHPDPLKREDMALILFSGGSTGKSKAIMLSSLNCNVLAAQTNAAGGPILPGECMLSILPMFHGFGLAVGIHTILKYGGTCILVPKFTSDGLAKLIRKYGPQYLAGVPTLFDALAANPRFRRTPLACFKGLFSGGDTLGKETKERFEAVLKKNGGTVPLREGYGLTETVTANILMPRDHYRERSIGVPYPDMMAKVVRLGTTEEAPAMEDGEICVSGPSLMLGYMNDPEETAAAVRTHPDGLVWLHTGDLGCMDADGFLYFKLRMKRIIKTSGVSVYPSNIEEVLSAHPAVRLSCVIGIPHPSKVQVPKGFVTLNEGWKASSELERELIELCKKQLTPYSCPRCIEFRDRLPLTVVGKVHYRKLEEEELTGGRGDAQSSLRD
jgi:long-chain acyl-CoA synthetase